MSSSSTILHRNGSDAGWRVEELAAIFEAEVRGDASRFIRDVHDPEGAGPDDAILLFDPSVKVPANLQAGVIIAPPECYTPRVEVTWLLVRDPLAVLAWIHARWFEPYLMAARPFSSDRSDVHVEANAEVSTHALIGPNTIVGKRTRIGPGAVIMGNVMIGEDGVIEPGVIIYPRVRIGARVHVQAGAVIGSEGFRYLPGDPPQRIPHVGKVRIDDDVTIGAGVCIDRAVTGETYVGPGSRIDNLVQVAHNVRIGRNALIAAQVGIAGSVRIGDNVMMGGQVGIADHVKIGDRVKIAAQAGVMRAVENGEVVAGSPALSRPRWLRLQLILQRLPDVWKQLQQLLDRDDRSS